MATTSFPKYNLPPDYHPPRAILLGWPTRTDTWRKNAQPAQAAIISLIEAILQHTTTPIVLLSNTAHINAKVTNLQRAHPARLKFHTLPMDDCWLRDTGPIFTTSETETANKSLVATCFRFNAWGGSGGGCYYNYENDQLLKHRIADLLHIGQTQTVDMILEGGSISTDGEGTLLTTEECLLHRNRNPNQSKLQIEHMLRRYLHVQKVIWLPTGAPFDEDTNGHVDNMATFVKPTVVLLLTACAQENAELHVRAREAREILENSVDARGRKLVIHDVPAGTKLRRRDCEAVFHGDTAMKRRVGDILCGSYLNFVLLPGVCFVPAFATGAEDEVVVAHDERARRKLEEILIDRRIVMVPAREILLGGGGLHCVSLQVPRV